MFSGEFLQVTFGASIETSILLSQPFNVSYFKCLEMYYFISSRWIQLSVSLESDSRRGMPINPVVFDFDSSIDPFDGTNFSIDLTAATKKRSTGELYRLRINATKQFHVRKSDEHVKLWAWLMIDNCTSSDRGKWVDLTDYL